MCCIASNATSARAGSPCRTGLGLGRHLVVVGLEVWALGAGQGLAGVECLAAGALAGVVVVVVVVVLGVFEPLPAGAVEPPVGAEAEVCANSERVARCSGRVAPAG